jgi:transcriptional regulator with XRE-family HTH domain
MQIISINALLMSQLTIGQRIKFLLDAQNLSIRKFARMLDVSDTNIRNYIERGSKPSSDVLEKMVQTIPHLNTAWLLGSEGEPFLSNDTPTTTNTAHISSNSGIGINTGTATQNITLEACQRELEAVKRDAASYQREIELLKGQLEDKNEIITLLRGGYNRSN